jgi:2-polyprenyl-3-methyl-5-hydroxy-6-metoxy-1,4-benzoquinol methylase
LSNGIDEWVWLNQSGIFDAPSLRRYVARFPPVDLMENVSGLKSERDFAKHGVDCFMALVEASPRALTDYRSMLDFGCGCGRLSRMLKGHPRRISGCDIDHRHVDFINNNLDFMRVTLSSVYPPTSVFEQRI